MQHHHTIITLFEVYTAKAEPANPSSDPRLEELEAKRNDILSKSQIALETLFRLYYLRHGFDSWDGFLLLFLNSGAFLSLSQLAKLPPSSPVYEHVLSTLILCAKGVHSQSKVVFMAEIVFAAISSSMEGDDLRRELAKYAVLTDHEARVQIMKRYVQSAWPLRSIGMSEDPESSRLDRIIHGIDAVDVNDEEDTEGGGSSNAE